MNHFTLKGCVLDFHRDAVRQLVYDPAPFAVPILLKADRVPIQGKTVDGVLEVDVLAPVKFTCFLRERGLHMLGQ